MSPVQPVSVKLIVSLELPLPMIYLPFWKQVCKPKSYFLKELLMGALFYSVWFVPFLAFYFGIPKGQEFTGCSKKQVVKLLKKYIFCSIINKTSLNFKIWRKKQSNACWKKVNNLSRLCVCDYNCQLKIKFRYSYFRIEELDCDRSNANKAETCDDDGCRNRWACFSSTCCCQRITAAGNWSVLAGNADWHGKPLIKES